MYALQYVLHSLCGGGYYNMRVPNIPVSNRHDTMSVGRKYRLTFQENARHVDDAPWGSRTTYLSDHLLPLRDAS